MDKIIELLEARWLVLLGLVVIVLGVVDLIWTQVNALPGGNGIHLPIGYRWEIATGPIEVVALGVLIIVGAQIMVAVQDVFLRDEDANLDSARDADNSQDTTNPETRGLA